ncbi:alpha/beta fold hydrolase [candidate division CSSED10-310 bacterium]|uniref:Alpha/beta fold hydrolase n=1 Tax=candidate division CSSED10-310 bacterium TaxID=2855610 RepID=A0ABV6YYZ1_UNCC1
MTLTEIRENPRHPRANLSILRVASLILCLNFWACGAFVKTIPPGQILDKTAYNHFVKVGEANLHYIEYPAEGPDVLLLHGFGSSSYCWDKVAPQLHRHGFHIWMLDMKGFGWSDKPKKTAYDPMTLMEEVNQWMDLMNLKDVVFVGNSLGGAIAGLLEFEHPERIGRVVLIDAAGYNFKKPMVIKLARFPLATPIAKLFFGRWIIKRMLGQVFYNDDLITAEHIEAYYDRLRTQNAMYAQVNLARSLNFNDFEHYFSRIKELETETLIIWGRDDQWIPLEIAYNFRKDLTNSRLVVIPECGHVPQKEKPERVVQLLLDFLNNKPIQETPLPEP